MKKLISLILIVFFNHSSHALTVGLVDVQKMLLSVKQGTKVKSKLKEEFEKKQKILKNDEDKIRKMQEELQKKSLVMKTTTRAKKEEEIQKEIMALQRKSIGFTKQMEELEQKLKRPIIERAKKIIEDISKKEKLDVTFERNAGSVLYSQNSKDITNQVIKSYDKKYPK